MAGWEAIAWHTPDWYRFQWGITELVTVTTARLQDGGWDDWRRWALAVAARAGAGADRATLDMLDADGGEYLSFVLLAAIKR